MIVANYAGWRLDLIIAKGKVEYLPIIAWWIDETDRSSIPRPITPIGVHDDPSTYRLSNGFGTLSPTPGAAPNP
jgi:hypothetical protein